MATDYEEYEGDVEVDDTEISFTEYEISASPNDFNVKTLVDFIGSGIVKIPGFQRNYVWDIKRASKLIESILIGIPIPQIFLYEQGKNNFLVVDGQQRYFTIYFFSLKRFPKKEKRFELRKIFDESKGIPENILNDNAYFVDFNLSLPEHLPGRKNRFNRRNYATLSDDDRTAFNLRTIRNIIVKQNSPDDGDSVVFEIFNRLNSGGVNLKPQEIRTSLYHSKFYDMLYRINMDKNWRDLTPKETPDLNMKDVEILLRGFAMLVNHEKYAPSLTKFLNDFSAKARKFSDDQIFYLESLFLEFTRVVCTIDKKIFFTQSGRFNISLYESIFVALTEDTYLKSERNIRLTDKSKVKQLKTDKEFVEATQSRTADTKNVALRLAKAKAILLS
ncbi:GmrSD restriction endonuclease domain-containing protein [Chryseosolibacter indicus]|uniref:DUF262 domain-containing protein n=1 Tax=Chryseosolibacter indicus TaxID=2782351 RepID=A0ABS5VZ36_9BACT|nr:DUF262 domain-containing protein [Chryseosolibacter indicus]MBT1706328.1 DUF262 domain-containing protein [Chryseosolibacter indicus]